MIDVIFSVESPASTRQEIELTVNTVWDEVGHGSMGQQKPDPDYEKYTNLYNLGFLHIAVARNNGKMVGYAILFTTNLMQHRTIKGCFVDSVFLDKSYRKGLTGYRFLKFIMECARTKDASRIEWGITVKNDFGPILERLGCSLESYRYGGDL